ncbi:asparaginase [Enterococcus columbae]|uniref:asparaginase n=1 Tax=Enterococcus columbae DSM 7374 = ATCC 51263 TaxID=1121865 RepID=S0KHX0_9ENTE|nr:asparaginase [Enterococcus columbae]EOT44404.1 hypothetical protein OMW_00460 [Enterococcus columbae DSM 7374 = ATCC 51263]EOW84562.1 hypothetical protein I568_01058 [Enterococcus columbae DSM 7374 = ATCC 51263]
MKKILMITTGGTIASKKMQHGLAPGISAEELLSFIPQVKTICKVETLALFNIDSTNMQPANWEKLAQTIKTHYDFYDGFVICHGTDTLAYTAAALSYLIQHSSKPIVLTGSQKPIDMDSTDAKVNLLDSFVYASDDRSNDVVIVFDGKVIAGTRAKKVRAKSYNAFTSINFPYLAVILDQQIIRYIPNQSFPQAVTFYNGLKQDLLTLKLTPGLDEKILTFAFEHFRCIILESFGVGGIPENLLSTFYQLMHKYQNERLVVVVSQVANEGSDMTIYEVGKKVKQDFQLLEAYDMTFESVVTKLMWLMARFETIEQMRQSFYDVVNYDILMTPNR